MTGFQSKRASAQDKLVDQKLIEQNLAVAGRENEINRQCARTDCRGCGAWRSNSHRRAVEVYTT